MFTFIIKNGVITDCHGYGGDTFVIPETDSEGNPVVGIEYLGFMDIDEPDGKYCREFKCKTITIPNTIKKISRGAFNSCRTLTEIHIPASVESIESGFAPFCDSLTKITVDPNNKFYDSRNDCNAVICTKTNTLIQGCANTIIPDGVKVIGHSAFQACRSLKQIVIPNSVTKISESAFFDCHSLENIFIPSSVCEIGDTAFYDCCSLESIYLPDSIKLIGQKITAFCENLHFLRIPSDVKVADNAFPYEGVWTMPSHFIVSTSYSKAKELTQRFPSYMRNALFCIKDVKSHINYYSMDDLI